MYSSESYIAFIALIEVTKLILFQLIKRGEKSIRSIKVMCVRGTKYIISVV